MSNHNVVEGVSGRARWIGWGTLSLALATAVAIDLPGVVARSPWEGAVFQGTGRVVELLLRLSLLVLALGGRAPSSALGVGAFVGGLAFRALGLVQLPAAVLPLARGENDVRSAATAGALVVLALVAHATGFDRVMVRNEPPHELPAQVVYFSERGNLFRARAAAAVWCARELPPGLGCLVLAEAEDAIGRREDAVRRAGAVLSNPKPEVRGRAADWLSQHGASP